MVHERNVRPSVLCEVVSQVQRARGNHQEPEDTIITQLHAGTGSVRTKHEPFRNIRHCTSPRPMGNYCCLMKQALDHPVPPECSAAGESILLQYWSEMWESTLHERATKLMAVSPHIYDSWACINASASLTLCHWLLLTHCMLHFEYLFLKVNNDTFVPMTKWTVVDFNWNVTATARQTVTPKANVIASVPAWGEWLAQIVPCSSMNLFATKRTQERQASQLPLNSKCASRSFHKLTSTNPAYIGNARIHVKTSLPTNDNSDQHMIHIQQRTYLLPPKNLQINWTIRNYITKQIDQPLWCNGMSQNASRDHFASFLCEPISHHHIGITRSTFATYFHNVIVYK